MRPGRQAFLRMTAFNLQFPDATFDVVVCIKTTFHFNIWGRLLREAYRVLKPGEWLMLSDIFSPQPSSRAQRRLHHVEANYDLPAEFSANHASLPLKPQNLSELEPRHAF